MTDRDVFAVHAMAALIQQLGPTMWVDSPTAERLRRANQPLISAEDGARIRQAVVGMAYAYADEMIEEREFHVPPVLPQSDRSSFTTGRDPGDETETTNYTNRQTK